MNAIPTISQGDFRAAMRNLAGGVALMTTLHDGIRHGMTITALTSVSAEPPTILIGINRRSGCHDILLSSGAFGVSLLGEDHHDIAMRFAGMTDIPREKRFDDLDWQTRVTGAPLLSDALATLDCRIIDRFDVGSHSLFIGSVECVTAASTGDPIACPLVNFQGNMLALRA